MINTLIFYSFARNKSNISKRLGAGDITLLTPRREWNYMTVTTKPDVNFIVSQMSCANEKRTKSFLIFTTLLTIMILKDSLVVVLGRTFPPIQLYSMNFVNMLLLLNYCLSRWTSSKKGTLWNSIWSLSAILSSIVIDKRASRIKSQARLLDFNLGLK